MGKNIEKRNILFKNRMCSPIIEARSTKRGCESIVKYCFFIVLVLIDTWWNVNVRYYTFDVNNPLVLIDTWWNVNLLYLRTLPESDTVLIDTWWNVNVIFT